MTQLECEMMLLTKPIPLLKYYLSQFAQITVVSMHKYGPGFNQF